ncbi:AraC family transcriptional regulator [Vibrio diabolicus]|uniref:AraC family transcriptional regulator n=1 Tax=Vibrio TaxID=662 RepID=UPI000D65E7AD|nr:MULTISPECIES: AraC family transcriptional regulator [Vibrio]MBO0147925.1 helix-turn-helix domain-containing protein [Vibrio sp. Vb2424]MCK8064943.1 AraC family transcriptional regulator [Vibrio sp. 1CM7H]MCR9365130.1 AraC family transcriptional regulator [Vibrio antiquarius]MCG9229523.1 AraC family transcriptional regulator [Vibrio diabolicus]MCG9571954.1 AraC family transcriptional regulator [Vibrio diabolicus]
MNQTQIRRNVIARRQGQHLHSYAQVLLGWRGTMACEFERESGNIGHGTVAIVPDNAPHFYNGLSEDSELLVIDLAPADPYIQALEQACNLSLKESVFQQPYFLDLGTESQILLDFAAQKVSQGQMSPQINCQLVSLFLTQLGQMSSSVTPPAPHRRLEASHLNTYIDQNISTALTNAQLAQAMHLSESHFYCLCQRQFGVTPQKYVMQRRMQKAQFLLRNSHMPMTELAAEVGFAQLSSFSRAYKRSFQHSPSDVRRKSR